MKKCRLFGIVGHAFQMVRRTLRSYALLSVTIVLSFTLLLGYLGYMDTSLYNRYKRDFKIDRGIMSIWDLPGGTRRYERLLRKIQEQPDTRCYEMYVCQYFMNRGAMETNEGTPIGNSAVLTYFLSGQVWKFFHSTSDPVEVRWLDGQTREEISLKPDEAILDSGTFCALGLDKMEEPVYHLCLHDNFSTMLERDVRIVGVIDTPGDYFIRDENDQLCYNLDYQGRILIMRLDSEIWSKLLADDFGWTRKAIIYTKNPQALDAMAADMGYTFPQDDEIYKLQDTDLEKIRTEKGTKALIVGALLLLLGINLYSSFSNALNERKFEIGVKRALGASSGEIVRQFLYESLIVMSANILLAINLAMDAGVIWKWIVEKNANLGPKHGDFPLYADFILYLSPHSAAMFAICAITLTVVFSLIFAYKSTQVEIVQYLKAE